MILIHCSCSKGAQWGWGGVGLVRGSTAQSRREGENEIAVERFWHLVKENGVVIFLIFLEIIIKWGQRMSYIRAVQLDSPDIRHPSPLWFNNKSIWFFLCFYASTNM